LYNAGEANSKSTVQGIRAIGREKGFEVIEATVSKSSDVYQATKSLVGRVDAVFIPTDNTVVSALESAVKVCTQTQLALFCADVDSVKRGLWPPWDLITTSTAVRPVPWQSGFSMVPSPVRCPSNPRKNWSCT
jgi:hypothetical protein